MEGTIRYIDGQPVETLEEFYSDSNEEYIDWEYDSNISKVRKQEVDSYITNLINNGGYSVNGSISSPVSYTAATSNFSGIFGMPYQFSNIVDPPVNSASPYKIGRKFNDKIFSLMPVLFLTPGEPKFMEGYSAKNKRNMAARLAEALGGSDPDEAGSNFDEGRFYSFMSNFNAYRNYANTALRALALYMGIDNVEIPIPGTSSRSVKLKNINIEDFMNNDFTKLFGTQCVVPFFLDAETSISDSFSNGTTDSIVSQTANGLSQNAREIQFIMGNGSTSWMKNIAESLAEGGANAISALGDIADVIGGRSLLTRITNELTTIVSGGKIVFPEIWSDSSYDHQYNISIKLRSPDPDPVSIFLNIYMPIILLVSMAAPRQIGNSSNSYESPFLVRATYKSIFSCELGIISSLEITKGNQGSWNVMGQPITADITLGIKDLYSNMMMSKSLGLISNTAQMDFLATMAGINLNEYEPLRMIKLWSQIIGNRPRDWANDMWGGLRHGLSIGVNKVLSKVSDTRFLR